MVNTAGAEFRHILIHATDDLIVVFVVDLRIRHVTAGELFGKDLPGGKSVFTVRFEVKNVAELESVRNKLLNVKDVIGSRRGQN